MFFGKSLSQEKNSNTTEIYNLVKKGNQYFRDADFENSLKILSIALNKAKLANNDTLSAFACNRIGRNFVELSESSKAIKFFEQGLKFAKNANDTNFQIIILINIANVYCFGIDKNLKKGIAINQEVLKLAKKINDNESIFVINMNLTITYFENNNFGLGKYYLEEINKSYEKYGDRDYFSTLNSLNGLYYSNINNDKKANQYFLKSIDFNDKISLREDKQTAHLNYSKFLNKIGDFKNAYYHQNKYLEIKDSLFGKRKMSLSSEVGLNIEREFDKQNFISLEREKKNQEKNLIKSKLINIFAIILSVVLIILLFVIKKNENKNIHNNEKLIKKNLELKIAIEKVIEANKVKSQFVSTISHELRTPLYGVIGVTDIIYSENKHLVNNKHLEALKFSANYLLSLINDILQISKIEESKIVLDNIIFNIHNEVSSICNSLLFIANKNNVIIDIKIDENIPQLIVGDQTRLSQILMNLLTNALKFTKNGTVCIELKLESIIDNFHFINFKIIDTGIGIAKENQIKIFEKFTQIKQNEDDYQGTGLGLSIVEKLINLFNSEIFLESDVNKGAAFSFTIGFEKANHNIKKYIKEEPINLDVRILVVEDNKINQMVTKKIIQSHGQYCKIVSGGFEAIDILKTEKFDTILMDINMPEINGFETSIKIREMGISIPIIALTAYNKKQVIQEAEISGINAVLVKPFEQIKLFELIKKELNKKNAN